MGPAERRAKDLSSRFTAWQPDAGDVPSRSWCMAAGEGGLLELLPAWLLAPGSLHLFLHIRPQLPRRQPLRGLEPSRP